MVFDLIERHQIRCKATRAGTIHAAHAASGLRDLGGAPCAEWAAMGEPVEMLDRDATAVWRWEPRPMSAALLDHRAGTVNPMGYCRGLARAARAAGARDQHRRAGDGGCKQAARRMAGRDRPRPVSARAVVLGTNAYTDSPLAGAERDLHGRSHLPPVIATVPLGPEADHILPGRQGVWDTAPVMTSIRRDARGRLIVGTMGRVLGNRDRGLSRRWADRTVRRLFRSLGPVAFEEAWHGQIAMTPDHLPRIHVLDEGLYTPIGYNGRGIITGTIFGQAMADLLTGMEPADLPLPVTDLAAVTTAPLMRRVYDLSFAANQLIKGF